MEEVANRDSKHRFRSLRKAHHKLGEEPNEGNEFSGALAKAKAAGAKTFKVGDKEYEVKEAEELEAEMEAGECNHTAEGVMCPVHGLKECGSGYMEDEVAEAAKPDYLDFDKDGDKEEDMKKALKDKEKKMQENELRRLAGLPVEEVADETVNEAQQVKFLGYNTTNYPLAKAIADKAYRNGTLVKLSMDANGKPMAIINDPESAGEYEAYWNDQAGAWAIDFD
jgi:hypothetical protein